MKRIIFIILCIGILGGAVFVLGYMSRGTGNSPEPAVSGPTASEREYTMLFVGDVMLDREVKTQIEQAQDPLYPFARIADTLRSADLTFINLEGPISARGTNQGSQYSFRFEPVGTINALQFAGVDIVNLANNHIWDWGKQALLDTFDVLEKAPMGYTGAGRDIQQANLASIGLVGDTKVALMGYTTLYPKSLEATEEGPGISSFSDIYAKALIEDVRRTHGAEVVVISMHWGEEYATSSSAQQQQIAHALIDAGADLIIGHHPHVVQEIEEYKGKYIVYSLGNFVFDQFFSEATMNGLMVRAYVKDKKITRIEEIPVRLTPTFQPYIVGAPGDPALDVVE